MPYRAVGLSRQPNGGGSSMTTRGVSLEPLTSPKSNSFEPGRSTSAETVSRKSSGRKRQIPEESLSYIDRQLVLVRRRRDEIARLEEELTTRRRRVRDRLRSLAEEPADTRS